MQFKSRADMMG